MDCLNKCWLDYVIAVVPPFITACIAGFVAWVAHQQWRTNSEKLRLDLYNRRFDVYGKALTFFQALITYDPATNQDVFLEARADFIKACRESRFLFDRTSGVADTLDGIHLESYKVSGFREARSQLAASDPENFYKMDKEAKDIALGLGIRIANLDDAMAPYLNFHQVTSESRIERLRKAGRTLEASLLSTWWDGVAILGAAGAFFFHVEEVYTGFWIAKSVALVCALAWWPIDAYYKRREWALTGNASNQVGAK